MQNSWLQERPHLTALARSMQTVLELADELYERGRGSGDSVDYSVFEERVAQAAAEVEQGVHQVALGGLDVDASYIRVWGKHYRRVHRVARTYCTLAGPVAVERTLYRELGRRQGRVLDPSRCAPASWMEAGCRARRVPVAHLVAQVTSREACATGRELMRLPYSRCSIERVGGDWDDYFGDRRLVALDDAAAHVRCKIHDAHRALCDARRCRAVWRYLTEPAERSRVDAAIAAREARREARWYLDLEEQRLEAAREREARRAGDAWMRWLRFPLWLAPAAEGHSPFERSGVRDAYVDDVTQLFTGYVRNVHELRLKHKLLPMYRRRTEIPQDLAPLSRLRLPRWADECVSPRACYVPASGRRFVLLYRLSALEEAYLKHPLRRPFDSPAGHALYTRTELRKAGFTKSEIEQLVPAVEAQRTWDWKWYPMFCMPERRVAARREARARVRQRPGARACHAAREAIAGDNATGEEA